MSDPRGRLSGRGIAVGVRAGAVAGLLTGLCCVFLFGGLDFSRGRPLAAFLELPPKAYGLIVLAVVAGAGAGAVVSSRTHEDH